MIKCKILEMTLRYPRIKEKYLTTIVMLYLELSNQLNLILKKEGKEFWKMKKYSAELDLKNLSKEFCEKKRILR